MPTNVSDQFYEFDPADPPPVGTPVSFFNYVLTDQNDDGDVDEFDADAVTGLDVTASWPGDTITINVSGIGDVTYTGTTLYLSDGSIIFTPTDGQVLEAGNFVSSTAVSVQGPLLLSQLGPPCFTSGTLIATPFGEKLVEDLREGDLVQTADEGAIPIRFIRKRTFDRAHFQNLPRHAPIQLLPGVLGPGLPAISLYVSPQHRILIRSKVAERMFGAFEILVAAAKLVGVPGISRTKPQSSVTYIHLLFDRHQIVFANQVKTESLLLGPNILAELRRDELAFLARNAPNCLKDATKSARTVVTGKRISKMLERMNTNELALTENYLNSHRRRRLPGIPEDNVTHKFTV